MMLLLAAVAVGVAAAQGCPVGWFQCRGSLDCVEQRHNCDSLQQCPDGSDEWNCSDVADAVFWDHLFRRQPAAGLDRQLLSSCGVPGLNSSCACAGRSVLCGNLGLRVAPPGLAASHHLHLLDLTGNEFPQVTPQLLQALPTMDTLALSHCGVRELQPASFTARRPRLSLLLDNNKLRALPEPLVYEPGILASLILSHNEIEHLPAGVFLNLHALHELHLGHNRLEAVPREALRPLATLRTLYLGNNRLGTVTGDSFPPLQSLNTLSLSTNHIARLPPGSFRQLPALEHLFLSWNKLVLLENFTFQELHHLRALNLVGNGLQNIELGAFCGLHSLQTLDLQKNSLLYLDGSVLQDVRALQYVYFDEFQLCSAALHVRVCEPRSDGISSLQHLLDNPVLRASVWAVALVAVSGNMAVLLGRCLVREPNPSHALYIRTLALSDLLMGIYLLLIAIADCRFRGVYMRHEAAWRRSLACNFCGFLSTLSSESSVLVLVVITWDRARSVSRPLVCRPASRRFAATLVTVLWFTAGTAALLPLTGAAYFGREYYGNNGVCLPLHIHRRFAQGWEYSVFMLVAVSSAALVYISASYWRMTRTVRRSGAQLRRSLERPDHAMARRFLLIVATDCLCWTPVIAVKLLALAGVQIDAELCAWLAVFVLPINSALNPLIYTLSTELFRKQVSRVLRTVRSESQHTVQSQQASHRLRVHRTSERSTSLGRGGSDRSAVATFV